MDHQRLPAKGAPITAAVAAFVLLTSCETPVEPLPLGSPLARPVHSLRLPEEVQLGAQVSSDLVSLTVSATFLNPTSETLTLSTGVCPFRLRAYRDPDLNEPAFWDDHRSSARACTDQELLIPIPPGESELELGVLTRSDLKMGFPARAGYFGVVVVHNGELRVLPAGTYGTP